MFGRKKQDAREQGRQAGEAMLDAIGELYRTYDEMRLVPLRNAVLEVFVQKLDKSLGEGIEPSAVRQLYAECEGAWLSELPQIKSELLDFRNMDEWLKVADVAGVRGQILDWMDGQLEEAFDTFRYSAAAKIGSVILTHGLDDDD